MRDRDYPSTLELSVLDIAEAGTDLSVHQVAFMAFVLR